MFEWFSEPRIMAKTDIGIIVNPRLYVKNGPFTVSKSNTYIVLSELHGDGLNVSYTETWGDMVAQMANGDEDLTAHLAEFLKLIKVIGMQDGLKSIGAADRVNERYAALKGYLVDVLPTPADVKTEFEDRRDKRNLE